MTMGILKNLQALIVAQLELPEKDILLAKADSEKFHALPYVFIACRGRSLAEAPGWEHWNAGKSFIKVRRIYRVEESFEIVIRRQDREEILSDISLLTSAMPSRIIVDDTIARLGIIKTNVIEGSGDLDHAIGSVLVRAEYGVYAKSETQAIKKIRIALATTRRVGE
ncbi:MAG: hypothetical protein ACRCY4_07105 [Brevinema sp.]